MGLALGRGQSPEEALREIGQVVEGVTAASAVRKVAERVGVEMPICLEVHRVMHEGRPVRDRAAGAHGPGGSLGDGVKRAESAATPS